jgi:hypothetical protein
MSPDAPLPLDPRLVLLERAAARLLLLEAGELDLDDACDELIDMHDWTWWRACARADTMARKRKLDPAIERAGRLLEDDVSLERAYAVLNSSRPPSEATIEAIKQAVRERGLGALKEPASQQRLRQCDDVARAEIDRWLQERKILRNEVFEPRT